MINKRASLKNFKIIVLRIFAVCFRKYVMQRSTIHNDVLYSNTNAEHEMFGAILESESTVHYFCETNTLLNSSCVFALNTEIL